MVVPILLSDYIIFHPVKVAMDRLNVGHLAHTAASLNHKIWFHHYDIDVSYRVEISWRSVIQRGC